MSELLLGCPHCAKPVGFAPAMAGKVVSCPYCRGQFQMPERPPASTAPPAGTGRISAASGDIGFSLEGVGPPAGGTTRAELDSYRVAVTLANIFALAGTTAVFAVLGGAMLLLLRGGYDLPYSAWMICLAAFVLAGFAIVGLFLIRACVLVAVDAARTLRTIERDTIASRKTM
jgi:hypothetical protein